MIGLRNDCGQDPAFEPSWSAGSPVRLAIHIESGTYSDRWVDFCLANGIAFTPVDCRRSDILQQILECDGLLWHWLHYKPEDLICAPRVLRSIESLGIRAYPNSRTCWHYDDKLGQKYLLEAVGAPLVPTYVFFRLEDALSWIDTVTFPKVFKLSRGAGSRNVRLVRSRQQASRLARRAFSVGFPAAAGFLQDARTRARNHIRAGDALTALLRLPDRWLSSRRRARLLPMERGYMYFQDFVPDNDYDTRVTVIGDRAFAYRRAVRPGDFRASGSGNIDYRSDRIDLRCVQTAFEVTSRIGAQSLAFDFVFSPAGDPLLLEVSYCFVPELVHECEGHWNRDLSWNAGAIWPQDAILIDFIAQLGKD